jgi:hypothetical protein
VPVRFNEVIAIWLEGERRLHEADPADQLALERAIQATVEELRRRLGGPFTTQELASLYGEGGTDWIFDVASRVAPSQPSAWDVPTVGGAAFARYAREASDYRSTRGRRPPGMEPE